VRPRPTPRAAGALFCVHHEEIAVGRQTVRGKFGGCGESRRSGPDYNNVEV